MEFNISHKVDPETKNFKIIIEGDKEFSDSLKKSSIFLNDLMNTFLNQIAEIYKKKKQKPLIHTDILNVKTINIDEEIAVLILRLNRDNDNLILIRDNSNKVIGLQIK